MDLVLLSDSPVARPLAHGSHISASAGDWALFLGLAGVTLLLVLLARAGRV